jgi:hypothetical protein
MGQTRPLVRQGEGELTVDVEDLRYGFPDEPQHGMWGVRVVLEADGAPAGGVRRIRRPRPVTGKMMRWLWRATFTGQAALHELPPAPRESR